MYNFRGSGRGDSADMMGLRMGGVLRAARVANGNNRDQGGRDDDVLVIDNCLVTSQKRCLGIYSMEPVERDGLETSSPDDARRTAYQPNNGSVAVKRSSAVISFTAVNTGKNSEVVTSLLESGTRESLLHRAASSGL